jgi:hypothetical protein
LQAALENYSVDIGALLAKKGDNFSAPNYSTFPTYLRRPDNLALDQNVPATH